MHIFAQWQIFIFKRCKKEYIANIWRLNCYCNLNTCVCSNFKLYLRTTYTEAAFLQTFSHFFGQFCSPFFSIESDHSSNVKRINCGFFHPPFYLNFGKCHWKIFYTWKLHMFLYLILISTKFMLTNWYGVPESAQTKSMQPDANRMVYSRKI